MTTLTYEAPLTTHDGQPLSTRPVDAMRLKRFLSVYQDFCRLVEKSFRSGDWYEPDKPDVVRDQIDSINQMRTFSELPLRSLLFEYLEETIPQWLQNDSLSENDRLDCYEWLVAAYDRALRSLMLWYEHYLNGDNSFQLSLPTTLEGEFLVPHGVYTFDVVNDDTVRLYLVGGFQATIVNKQLVDLLRKLWSLVYRDKTIELPPLYLIVNRDPATEYNYRVSFRLTDKFLQMVKRRRSHSLHSEKRKPKRRPKRF